MCRKEKDRRKVGSREMRVYTREFEKEKKKGREIEGEGKRKRKDKRKIKIETKGGRECGTRKANIVKTVSAVGVT